MFELIDLSQSQTSLFLWHCRSSALCYWVHERFALQKKSSPLVSWLAYNWRLFGVRHGFTAFSFFSGERVLNLYLTAEELELSWKTIIWEWGSQGRWWPYAWDPFYWSYECIHSAVRYDWSIDSRSSSLKRVRNDRNQELGPLSREFPLS